MISAGGLPQTPLGEHFYSAPPDPLAGLRDPTSKEREGRGGKEKGREGGERGGMRNEGGERGGRRGEGRGVLDLPFKYIYMVTLINQQQNKDDKRCVRYSN